MGIKDVHTGPGYMYQFIVSYSLQLQTMALQQCTACTQQYQPAHQGARALEHVPVCCILKNNYK
jgi:hypothetical protein